LSISINNLTQFDDKIETKTRLSILFLLLGAARVGGGGSGQPGDKIDFRDKLRQ
jgi:hypothetical protein